MFCSIIGYPLSKPRSVKIWRNFFKKKKMNIQMLSLEIKKNSFNDKINEVIFDRNFLASAITMPYKKKILKYIEVKDKISKKAKSINFIIKKKSKIFGFNTDVYGALETVKKLSPRKKKIMIFGFGGAGEAISRVFLTVFKKMNIYVISKKKCPLDLKKKKINFFKKVTKENLSEIDIFINCSPLGSNLKNQYKNKSPLTYKLLKDVKKTFRVFDIVYNPKVTFLMKLCKKLGLKSINGIEMNNVQAKFALQKVYSQYQKII